MICSRCKCDRDLNGFRTCGQCRARVKFKRYAAKPLPLDYRTMPNPANRRNAKLIRDNAELIRMKRGEVKGPAVAAMFGVSETTVYQIWAGRTWK